MYSLAKKRKLEPEEGRYAHSHKKKAKKEDFPSVPPADCPIFELPPEIMVRWASQDSLFLMFLSQNISTTFLPSSPFDRW